MERGVRSALVRMHGQGCVSFILFGFLSAHMCIVSEDVMILNVYTRHAEYLPTQLIYHVHGLPWTFAVQELSTKATTHSGAALTSKGSERRAMPVQCQNIPATICICSGTVLGCSEAVVCTLPSVSPEVVESFFLLLADIDESPSPEVQTPPGGREPILFG